MPCNFVGAITALLLNWWCINKPVEGIRALGQQGNRKLVNQDIR